MSDVFQNIDPPIPSPPASVYPPPPPTPRLWCGGRTHSLGGEGWGVNSSEDAKHCSVLYICKNFVVASVGMGCRESPLELTLVTITPCVSSVVKD